MERDVGRVSGGGRRGMVGERTRGKGWVERSGEGGLREGMSIKGHRMCEGLGEARLGCARRLQEREGERRRK